MGGAWTDIGSGAMVAEFLFDGGGDQVGHGVGPLATALGGTLGGHRDSKNP